MWGGGLRISPVAFKDDLTVCDLVSSKKSKLEFAYRLIKCYFKVKQTLIDNLNKCVRIVCFLGWINALIEFFRVVEFPVLGYSPPVVLTEMHFLLNHCAVELSPASVSPARGALCLGKVKVTCSILDTTQVTKDISTKSASLISKIIITC